jgi:hypothetical protein
MGTLRTMTSCLAGPDMPLTVCLSLDVHVVMMHHPVQPLLSKRPQPQSGRTSLQVRTAPTVHQITYDMLASALPWLLQNLDYHPYSSCLLWLLLSVLLQPKP